jgi:hypothetical protein
MSFLLNPYILATVAEGAPDPPITTNLELYVNPDYDVYSDAIGTAAVDGDNIREVLDQSGNSNTADQSTASLQPVYKTSVLGGGNASIQIGSGDYFDLSSTLAFSSGESFTFYIVYKKSVNTRNSAIGSSANDRIDLRASYVQTFIASDNSFINHTDNTDLKIITVVVDRTASTYEVYKNKTSLGSNSKTFSAASFTRLFGSNGVGGGDIDYGIALMYKDAHSSTDVGTVSDWLNTKYSIY